jgi:type IV pilus assembly protein PilM
MAISGVRVGIDLEQNSVAGVQTKGLTLTHAGVRAIQEGLLFEGEVLNGDLLAEQLKAFWKESGFTGKRFTLGVANQRIVVRTEFFPMIADDKELRPAVEFWANESIPIAPENRILDFDRLDTVVSDDGTARQRVLIVAAQSDMIQQFTEVAKKAGLTLEGIDLQAFALVRSMAPRVAFVDQGASTGVEAAALVNIGKGITSLAVVVNGAPLFTRVIGRGYETLVDALQANRGIEWNEADVMRMYIGFQGTQPALADYEPQTVAEVRAVLDDAGEVIADEIRRSVDYYQSLEISGPVVRVLLSGEGALTQNICEYLGQALHTGVELGHPLQYITENKTKMSDLELQAIGPRLAIAVGLALDDEG